MGHKLVVARPLDGAPVVLAPTAAIVWRQLDGWSSRREIDRQLASVYPNVATDERCEALTEILDALANDDLLERI